MKLDYIIKQFSNDLFDDFLQLARKSFSVPLPEKRMKELFKERGDYLGYIAYINKKPIAFFGAIESDFIINGKLVRAAQSILTMVHPDFRSGNYFYELFCHTVELAKKRNIKFIFGWPNSPRVFEKLLKWKDLGPFSKITVRVKTIPLSIIARRIKIFYPVFHCYSNLILSLFKKDMNDEASRLLNAEKQNYIPRSPEYLAYKKRLGAKIFKINSKYLLVNCDYKLKLGDLQPVTVDEFDRIMRVLIRIAFFAGIAEIVFYTDKSIGFTREILEKYKSSDDIKLLYYAVDENITLSSLQLTLADFDTF